MKALKDLLPTFILLLLMVCEAMGYTGSTSGFAGEVYDIVVNKLLNGPVGFVAGVGCLVYGTASLVLGRVVPAVLSILGGAMLIKAPSIAQTLGMLF